MKRLTILFVLAALAAAAPSASAVRAHVRLVSASPVRVSGSGFAPGERVTVTVTAGKTKLHTSVAPTGAGRWSSAARSRGRTTPTSRRSSAQPSGEGGRRRDPVVRALGIKRPNRLPTHQAGLNAGAELGPSSSGESERIDASFLKPQTVQ